MVSISQARVRAIENWLIVPLAALVGGTIAYWAMVLDRIPPIALHDGEIIPNRVRGGEPITAKWRVEVRRSTSYNQQCTREIVDSLNTFRRVDEQERSGLIPPMSNYLARSVNVPFDTAWGRAYYRQQCCYEIEGISLTRLFPICERRPELPFDILPPPK